MFLGALTDKAQQSFFLELARLVAITEGDVAAFEESIDWSNAGSPTLAHFYKQMIDAMTSETERQKFHALVSELGYSASSMPFNTLHRSYARHGSSRPSTEDFDESVGLSEKLSSVFANAIKAKGADPELTKRVLNNLIEHGIELSEINNTLVKIKLSLMPEIREPALLALVDDIFARRQEAVQTLTLPERKAIMLELTAMGDVSGSMEPIERKILEHIQQGLGLDVEFLDEAAGIVQKINAASLEAFELITE